MVISCYIDIFSFSACKPCGKLIRPSRSERHRCQSQSQCQPSDVRVPRVRAPRWMPATEMGPVPSGKHTKSDGKSPFFMGKSAIVNGNFQ